MNPYHQFVSQFASLVRDGKNLPLAQFEKAPRPQLAPDAPKVLIFSPHPDDEVIIGGVALRLLREAKWNVINVAVTQGSNKSRQAGRLSELKGCCENIGFGLMETIPGGLERIYPKTREQEPAHWAECVKVIARILADQKPKVILVPHDADWNSCHIGTHYLILDALKTLPASFKCHVIETEFWGAMWAPNLMVEISEKDLADLITALTYHVEEVRRNPYHLLLPAWMQDNVRRGSELVGGQGGAAANFTFATVYRLQKWENGKLEKTYTGGKQIGCKDDLTKLFE